MGVDTTKASYWLNWRFLLCAIYVVATMVIASVVIWKYEGKARLNDEPVDGQQLPVGVLYKEEAWRTCLKGLHPGWLLSFRIVAFITLLVLMVSNAVYDGPGAFYFYTQWTVLLTTIFFGVKKCFWGVKKSSTRAEAVGEHPVVLVANLTEEKEKKQSPTRSDHVGRNGAGCSFH